MFVGVEQAVEIEARCPLVLCFQDGLGVVHADPPDVLCELTVGSHQILCGVAQPTVRRVNLLDECAVGHRHHFSSPPVCSPASVLRRSPSALARCSPELCPCPSVSLTSTGTPSQLARLLSRVLPAPPRSPRRGPPPRATPSWLLHVAPVQKPSTLLAKSVRSYAV